MHRGVDPRNCYSPPSLEQTPVSSATNIWPILRTQPNVTSGYLSSALSLKTLLFSISYLDSFSNLQIPPPPISNPNTIFHSPLMVFLPDSLDLDLLPIDFWAIHKVRHAILDQLWPLPLSRFVTHLGTPKSTSHISDPPIFSSTCTHTCLYRGVCLSSQKFWPGGLSGFFAWKVLSGVVFVHTPFCQNTSIHYNRKLHITFNFRFHMYEFFLKCDITCSWTPPLSQAVTPSRTTSPSSVTYFRDGPFVLV